MHDVQATVVAAAFITGKWKRRTFTFQSNGAAIENGD